MRVWIRENELADPISQRDQKLCPRRSPKWGRKAGWQVQSLRSSSKDTTLEQECQWEIQAESGLNASVKPRPALAAVESRNACYFCSHAGGKPWSVVCVCVVYHDLQLSCHLLPDIWWTRYDWIRSFALGLIRRLSDGDVTHTEEETLQSGRRDWVTRPQVKELRWRKGVRAAQWLPVFPIRTVCGRRADKLTNYTRPKDLRAQIVQFSSPWGVQVFLELLSYVYINGLRHTDNLISDPTS